MLQEYVQFSKQKRAPLSDAGGLHPPPPALASILSGFSNKSPTIISTHGEAQDTLMKRLVQGQNTKQFGNCKL